MQNIGSIGISGHGMTSACLSKRKPTEMRYTRRKTITYFRLSIQYVLY